MTLDNNIPAGKFNTIVPKDLTIPLVIAGCQLIIQIVFHNNYGYFRDELYYIACSDHLAFGYVDHPPLSIAILWFSRMVFGDSLQAIRLLPSLAGGASVILTAMMARRLGGGKFTQGFASLCVVAAHTLLAKGQSFSMNSFDILFWTSACYVLIIILSENRQKLWILFGIILGIGLQNKYSIGFMCIGLFAGLVLTSQRKQLALKWFWLGMSAAAVIFLPHIIWEIMNKFPSLEFMHNASQNKNIKIGILDFLIGQFRELNFFNGPVWILGIYFFYRHENERFRPLTWMYPVVFLTMVVGNAKVYYLSPIYPLFFAGGAVFLGRYLQQHSLEWLKPVYTGLLILSMLVGLPFALPVLPVERFIAYEKFLGLTPRAEERSSVAELPQYYADQFGWEEMAATVASVYKKLTPEEQAQCVIYMRNYGEAGAIDFFGKKYGLPGALCAHNNYWLWGPGQRTGNIAILVGDKRSLQENLADLKQYFNSVEFVAATNAAYAMPFENGRQIFLCKGMYTTFQSIWPKERFYI